ncbi:MAG: CPBP family intramembrane metalloprotease [Sphingomonadales bacterium]|nr:CPBP family intramembrane metalloprotease [Sphingomonadales bacterium]
MSMVLFGLLAAVGPALSQIGALKLTLPVAVLSVLGAWFWVSVEAGLAEEFLFRAALQSRIAAWLKSPVVAILLVSVIFALAHWPGLYFRGTPETHGSSADPVQVAAYTIAALSPLSILFGVIWQRTHGLLLVVLLHGAVDALPFTAEFISIWG